MSRYASILHSFEHSPRTVDRIRKAAQLKSTILMTAKRCSSGYVVTALRDGGADMTAEEAQKSAAIDAVKATNEWQLINAVLVTYDHDEVEEKNDFCIKIQ